MITYTDRPDGEKLSKRIDAYVDGVRVGYIVDSCCQTKVIVNEMNPIEFLYETGKGGYLAKTKVYDSTFKEAFEYIYNNKWLQDVLKKSTTQNRALRISKKQIANWKFVVDSFNVNK